MKRNVLIAVFYLMIVSCSIDKNSEDSTAYKVEWHLTNVSGGISGINQTFSMGTIIWTFYNTTGMISVDNKNEDVNKEDGLDHGNYEFSTTKIADKTFIIIDTNEFGEITFPTENQFIIDKNCTSEGTGADGFIYNFTKNLVKI
ncbi:hypothetical protein QLS71_001155 [Mariniflexile litorale]|uniref:Lipocalin-like domain-containing protein n=1 Tax=Mariniflexile litorale TaxID=3045158 RepID=A0AAU7EGH2_9FLAO|nr:hypothetical protein [Mariniflexile sp. KMM 9835]MDQ8213502.1 hypothetical protein [Mariniflexile sp. KMM 9835]